MDRPFIDATIEQLEEVFERHLRKRPVLAKLREELEHRRTRRARQLLKEVEGVLDEIIPLEEESPEDSPDYQITLDVLLEEEEEEKPKEDTTDEEDDPPS